MNMGVRFTVDAKGKVKQEVFGYVGTSCKDATKAFEKLGVVSEDIETPEMYQTNQETQVLKQ